MSEGLSETYWTDVNRYCGELLAGAPVERLGFLVVSSAVRKVSWKAAARNTTATLENGTIRYLGGLAGKDNYHVLRLINPAPDAFDMEEYTIAFNPNKQVIEHASSGLVFKLPQREVRTLNDAYQGSRDIIRYKNSRVRLDAEMEALGLQIPGPADYDLLLSELQRGVTSETSS